MRKHYAVAGVIVAVVVAGLIVVAGTRSSDKTATATETGAKGASASLPPGHPSIAPTSSAQAQPDYGKMIGALEAKYRKHPANTKVCLALADAYLMNERPAKARALYAKVLQRDPGNEEAKVQSAMALHALGDDEQALSLLGDVIEGDPNSQLAHYNLAILYFSEQKADQAKSEWKKTAQIDPTTSIGRSAQNFVNLMDNSSGAPHPSST